MAEATNPLNVLVTGGAEGAGLATARALLKRGHKVAATACDSEGALAIRLAGALPVFPDLSRSSAILSTLQMTKAYAIIHAGPQYYGGAPHAGDEFAAHSDQLVEYTAAVTEAAKQHGVKRIISLSFGYLYQAGLGAAKEGSPDAHDGNYAPMLLAESFIRESGLRGYIVRSAYIYGGNSADTVALAESIKESRRLPAGALPASWIHEDDLASAVASLLETEAEPDGVETINAAANAATPNEFCSALSNALGLNEPGFASAGFLSMFREKSLRDKLLEREIIIDSGQLRDRFAWQPRYESLDSGMEATALVWRMKDAVPAEAFYGYEDAAHAAIASFAYEVALPEPVAAEEATPTAEAPAAPEPAPVQASAPPPSEGPTPWNEDDAKREERRRRALERKAKRAAKSA